MKFFSYVYSKPFLLRPQLNPGKSVLATLVNLGLTLLQRMPQCFIFPIVLAVDCIEKLTLQQHLKVKCRQGLINKFIRNLLHSCFTAHLSLQFISRETVFGNKFRRHFLNGFEYIKNIATGFLVSMSSPSILPTTRLALRLCKNQSPNYFFPLLNIIRILFNKLYSNLLDRIFKIPIFRKNEFSRFCDTKKKRAHLMTLFKQKRLEISATAFWINIVRIQFLPGQHVRPPIIIQIAIAFN